MDAAALICSAAETRASSMYSSVSNKFGNAFKNRRDARVLSILSWMTARIRGLCTVSINLFDPCKKTRSVSVGHVSMPRMMAGPSPASRDAGTLSSGLPLAEIVVGTESLQTGRYKDCCKIL